MGTPFATVGTVRMKVRLKRPDGNLNAPLSTGEASHLYPRDTQRNTGHLEVATFQDMPSGPHFVT